MKVRKLTRALALGVCASLLAPALAEAQIFRFFDPTQQAFVTYDTAPQANRNAAPDPIYQAQVVDFATAEAPGTIIVDTQSKFLYFVLKDQMAIRYGVGVGKEGFGWNGTVRVGAKQEWPSWTPPAEMIQRRPELVEYAGGMPGGPTNPLGARRRPRHDVPHPRHQRALVDRPQRLVRLHPHAERPRRRALPDGQGRHEGDRPVSFRRPPKLLEPERGGPPAAPLFYLGSGSAAKCDGPPSASFT
jgi:hypothetical protein